MFGGTSDKLPFEIGKAYFFRTVTHHLTGHVTAIDGKFLTLETAAWIADDGRFNEAMKTGVFSEVEPFSEKVFINTDSLIDATDWPHSLPIKVK